MIGFHFWDEYFYMSVIFLPINTNKRMDERRNDLEKRVVKTSNWAR